MIEPRVRRHLALVLLYQAMFWPGIWLLRYWFDPSGIGLAATVLGWGTAVGVALAGMEYRISRSDKPK